VKIVYSQKKCNKPEKQNAEQTLKIPIIYVQLIDQFCTEMDLSKRNKAHEALCQGGYAVEILEHMETELKTCSANREGFYSQVLTPILQQYIQGIPNSYTPIVYKAILQASALAEELAKFNTQANVQDNAQVNVQDNIQDDTHTGDKGSNTQQVH
jgi:hypothetical protein